ncbi:MAG: VWA domain-containing protein [Spirochaetes bacterium]|nr:VWA domain-containing protein [Spirochaetota bacterium]
MKGIRIVVVAAALAIAASVTIANAAVSRPRVEVAFVLDSTGSMDGLIEGAKQKIWSIANAIISRSPAPEVRIGLVSYRDRGDEYVTRLFDLTDDIDAVFGTLQSFRADGGGDDLESVNQALYEAVTRMSWTKDPGVLKVVFLVGDYGPHMDYRNDAKYPDTCREAVKRLIVINTVQCGGVAETTPVWQEIARLSEGSYVALAQDGNMQAMTTPYDEEIAKASAEISRTLIAYGKLEVQTEVREKAAKAEAAPASVAADRAVFILASGGKAVQGAGDLVADLESGAVDLAKVAKDDLPPEMQRMSLSEQRAYVQERQAERDSLNARLEKLSQQRAAFIETELRRLAGSGDSFDRSVSAIINTQAARVFK